MQCSAPSAGARQTVRHERHEGAFVRAVLASGLFLMAVGLATSAQRPTPPVRWVGAQVHDARVAVTVAEGGGAPRVVVTEPDQKRRGYSVSVTDIALDTTRHLTYVGTCCEPGSGELRRVDLRASTPRLVSDDQGFRVDAAGKAPIVARTDTSGTLAVRRSPDGPQELRAQAGVSDVAIDSPEGTHVVALIQTSRLRAVIPTVTQRDPGALVLRWSGDRWTDESYPLTAKATYCGVVALSGGSIGLLAGQVNASSPIECAGDRLDVYNLTTRQLRAGAITFPAKVRHLSIDDTSTFLIVTTVEGAVRWHTLAGASGSLAPRGFVAADW